MIPFSLPRTFGRMVGSVKQGAAILVAMVVLWAGALTAALLVENAHPASLCRPPARPPRARRSGSGSRCRRCSPCPPPATSTGAVDSMHSSYTGFGGGVVLLNMLLGEISPGGTGSGLYGMLVLAVITVFVAGLMVGRTPTYLGKRIGGTQMKYAAGYLLVTPAVVLLGTGGGAVGAGRPGRGAERRTARADRDRVRLRLRRQQQRIGVRRALARTPTSTTSRWGSRCSSAACCPSRWSSVSPDPLPARGPTR